MNRLPPRKRSRWRSGWYSRQQDEAPLGTVTGWPYRRLLGVPQCLAVGVQNIDRARIDAIFFKVVLSGIE